MHGRFGHAIARLVDDPGRATASLARELGRSRQHLRRTFLQYVGVGPKTFARVVRMQRAVARLQDEPTASLAELAVDLGYFDQAHMARDLRQLTGATPVQVRRGSGSIFPIRSLYGGVCPGA